MDIRFWKLSQGTNYFSHQQVLDSIHDRVAYVHEETAAKGTSSLTQGEQFIAAAVGDYFYLTHGNQGIYVLGQFTGPVNVFSAMGDGWLDRPYRLIREAIAPNFYAGPRKWWAPNENSTFVEVPAGEYPLFEQYILQPHFDIRLADYGV